MARHGIAHAAKVSSTFILIFPATLQTMAFDSFSQTASRREIRLAGDWPSDRPRNIILFTQGWPYSPAVDLTLFLSFVYNKRIPDSLEAQAVEVFYVGRRNLCHAAMAHR
jgi:hypothetical protein